MTSITQTQNPFCKHTFFENVEKQTLKNHQKYSITFNKSQKEEITCSYEHQGIKLGEDLPLIIAKNATKPTGKKLDPYSLTLISKEKVFVYGKHGLMGGMMSTAQMKAEKSKKSMNKIQSLLSKLAEEVNSRREFEITGKRGFKGKEPEFGDTDSKLDEKFLASNKFYPKIKSEQVYQLIDENPFWIIHNEDPDLKVHQWVCGARVQTKLDDLKPLITAIRSLVSKPYLKEYENIGVHINTGTHGTPFGHTAATAYLPHVKAKLEEADFFDKDFNLSVIKDYNNISLHQVTKNDPPVYPKKANFIIDAFCYSLFALEHIPEYPQLCAKKVNAILELTIEKKSLEDQRLNDKEDCVPKDKESMRAFGTDAAWQLQEVAERLEAIKNNTLKINKIPGSGYRFGAREWKEHFGVTVTGDETTFKDFDNIRNVLGDPCPFHKTKKVWETHLMTLIPKDVTIKDMKKYIVNPEKNKEGIPHGYETSTDRFYVEGNVEEAEHKWVLVTKDVIPDSRKKNFQEQKDLLYKSGENKYTVPKARDMALSILGHYVRSGEFLYSNSPYTYTRTEDALFSNYRVFVGGFGSGGLLVDRYGGDDRFERYGLGALRKF